MFEEKLPSLCFLNRLGFLYIILLQARIKMPRAGVTKEVDALGNKTLSNDVIAAASPHLLQLYTSRHLIG